ncbi:unnamed protein product [Phytophthora lilii]|uniref:Unnamed protein product n=1 Tax=Phytophthora lilii TaxID=2077276 RepID=A0A9W7CMU1_9STRA|nr:unnamed protein product [Phytophthora lilii]
MSGIPDFGASLPKIQVSCNDKLLEKNIFSHYFTRGRHFKLSTIFLSHSYFATDKMIRLNSEYVAILRANSKRDLQIVVKYFNIKGVDDRSIVYYYNKATEQKGQMLFIDSVRVESGTTSTDL